MSKEERLIELALQGKAVIKYHEPREDGNALITISSREAIEQQTEACIQRLGFDIYLTERDALLDFIAVNWAWIEESKFTLPAVSCKVVNMLTTRNPTTGTLELTEAGKEFRKRIEDK